MAFVRPETFLDGLFDVWMLDDRGFPDTLFRSLHYQNRIVGSKRNYEALAAGHVITKVVWVPVTGIPTNKDLVIQEDGEQYHVLQTQELSDKFPRLTQLTLECSPMIWHRNVNAYLVKSTYTVDELRQRIPTEAMRMVSATVRTIRQTPSDGPVAGMGAAVTMVIPAAEYQKELVVVWDERRFQIVSAYQAREDILELSLEEII